MKESRNNLRLKRVRRVRAKISGTGSCPRLSVFRSLKTLRVQAIDDAAGKTLVSANLSESGGKNDVEGAKSLGLLLAKKCLEKKIEEAVFDRSGYRYHGKVKAVAEGAREGGLRF